ncbi:MAG: TraR/DksA family transcriptional regulator [Elusimicrobia bacterium]|nr:TraR/DksA family transcriptional regulator [Elusimicrobiota bacterium]
MMTKKKTARPAASKGSPSLKGRRSPLPEGAARKPSAGKPAPAASGKLTPVKRKLLEMREDLIRTVRTQQLEESAEADTGDDADKASQSIEKELLFELSDNERTTLDHIEAALRKIDKGTYGTCESCRKSIPKPRLEALPFARYCIGCQGKAESVPELAEPAADFRGIGEETSREA